MIPGPLSDSRFVRAPSLNKRAAKTVCSFNVALANAMKAYQLMGATVDEVNWVPFQIFDALASGKSSRR